MDVRWLVVMVVVIALGDARAEHFAVRTFTTADGLSNGRVYHATRDRNGFLWFATADGVSRFDGRRFEAFGIADGLPSPGCRDIRAVADGRIWVATEHGLAVLDLSVRARRPHFTAIHVSDGPADFGDALFEDAHHQLWLGTEDGLWRIATGDKPERVALRPGRQPAVYAFAEQADVLWLGTSAGLMRRYADGRAEAYRVRPPSEPDDRTISVRLDHTGRLWVGGVGVGVFALVPPRAGEPLLRAGETLTSAAAGHPGHDAAGAPVMPRDPGEVVYYGVEDGLPFDAVRRGVLEDSRGVVWLAGGSLVAFTGDRFATRGRAQGFPEDSVAPLIEDPEGNVWFGGFTAGVVRYSPFGLVTYDAQDGLDSDHVMSVVEDREGTVFAVSGTNDGHTLERFDRDHFVAIHPKPPVGGETLGAWGWNQISFFDRDDRWWQATQTGLDHYPRVTPADALATTAPEHFGIRDGLPGRDIYRLFEDHAGDVWIATLSKLGLARWDRATNHITPVVHPALPAEVVQAFAADATGAVWIGYDTGALARIRGDSVHTFAASDGWAAHHVEALLVDRRGELWVGTDEGLARIADPGAARLAVTRYRAGLSTDQITALADDELGRIYVGTIHGIDRLEPRTGAIDHITVADGLPSDFVNAVHRDHTGQVWFATHRGLARMMPRREPAPVVMPAVLTSVRAGSRELAIEAGGEHAAPPVELAHDDSNLDATFTSPSFAVGVPVEFQLRLEGADDDAWSMPQAMREAHFSHLAPGRYRLSVRAVIAGLTSPAATLELEVLAPFWRRTWFLLALACGFVLVGWRIYRWRVDHLIAVERVRSRIASDLHDDLGASLARISILSEVASRRSEGIGELVATIGRDARELLEAASDVVWATDPRHDDLAHVLARIREFAGELFDGPGIAWTLTAPEEPDRIALGPDQRRHLYLVLKEAVANVSRHAAATRVAITVERVLRGLVVTIEDDGCGIADDAEMGHGLENMRERARQAGGTLLVSTPAGGGTRIVLAMPTR